MATTTRSGRYPPLRGEAYHDNHDNHDHDDNEGGDTLTPSMAPSPASWAGRPISTSNSSNNSASSFYASSSSSTPSSSSSRQLSARGWGSSIITSSPPTRSSSFRSVHRPAPHSEVAGKEPKEGGKGERKGSGRIEVEGPAKVQLISKLRDLLHDGGGLLRSSSSAASSSSSSSSSTAAATTMIPTTTTERRADNGEERGESSRGARLSRSLSLKRLTGGKGGSLRKSDEGGRMRMNRSHSLSRDSVVGSTASAAASPSPSPSSSSSTIWRTDRDRSSDLASADPPQQHGQRERRSSSTGSGSGGSRRGSLGRHGDASRGSTVPSSGTGSGSGSSFPVDEYDHGQQQQQPHEGEGEGEGEGEDPHGGLGYHGSTADAAESAGAEVATTPGRKGSKREKKEKKKRKKDKTTAAAAAAAKTSKKQKTDSSKKQKTDKLGKKRRKNSQDKGGGGGGGVEEEAAGKDEQVGKAKRGGGSELRRSVSWYKEAHNPRLDRIVAGSAGDKSAALAPKKEKSRSLRNIFQLLTFSQEVKANGNKVVSKLPGEGARPKRSPSDPSSGGGTDDRLYSSGELSDDAPARQHRNAPPGPSLRRSGAPKDPRLTVSAEELRGSGGSWAAYARSHPRAAIDGEDDDDDDDDGDDDDDDDEENSDEDPKRDEADEDGDADEDDDFRESDRKARAPSRRQAASSGDTTATERHDDGGGGGGDNDDGKAGRKGDEAAAEDGWKRKKKPKPKPTTTTTVTAMSTKKKKKKKRKSEAALERRLADIERLRRLVDDLHVLLAGHPVLPVLTEPAALRRDPGAAADTREAEGEELEWRASTEHVVGKVVEVMLQARALFHSCPDEIQRADILFMARQLNASAHRLADVLDSRPRCPTLLGAFVQHRIELTAASLELVVACGLPEEWMRAYTDDAFLSDA